jgi:hypothetical protein
VLRKKVMQTYLIEQVLLSMSWLVVSYQADTL